MLQDFEKHVRNLFGMCSSFETTEPLHTVLVHPIHTEISGQIDLNLGNCPMPDDDKSSSIAKSIWCSLSPERMGNFLT